MTQAAELLPISSVVDAASCDEVANTIRAGYETDTAVYPIGGGTSLDFGWPAKKPGVGLSLKPLNRVVDYPARDLTITIEAGISMKSLADQLAEERQRLPIDVPQAEQATLGGVVATNFNGPRRYGHGSMRDYVIGIQAVDGRGMPYKGGGRVVKNVAGYDFCKLLTGSLGTIGVVTQLTLKLKPLAEKTAIVFCAPRDGQDAEKLLGELAHSQATPVAIELMAGKKWASHTKLAQLKAASSMIPLFLAVAVEGTEPEVRWMVEQLGREWWSQGVAEHLTLIDGDAESLMRDWIEFPAAEAAPLLVKASVVPSQVTTFIETVRKLDASSTVLSHAGNGIVLARLSQAPAGGATKGLIGTLQTAAANAQGTLIVLAGAGISDPTHRSVWGASSAPQSLLTAVKREFDPRNILNPDRFVYAGY